MAVGLRVKGGVPLPSARQVVELAREGETRPIPHPADTAQAGEKESLAPAAEPAGRWEFGPVLNAPNHAHVRHVDP